MFVSFIQYFKLFLDGFSFFKYNLYIFVKYTIFFCNLRYLHVKWRKRFLHVKSPSLGLIDYQIGNVQSNNVLSYYYRVSI